MARKLKNTENEKCTIQRADRIFVIDKGGILEQGSPAELMEKKGHYYSLYMAQFKNVS